MPRTIVFKNKKDGRWLREDILTRENVYLEQMRTEIKVLVACGWKVKRFGDREVQKIEVTEKVYKISKRES